jgi:hypothetical protein
MRFEKVYPRASCNVSRIRGNFDEKEIKSRDEASREQ